MSEYHDSFNDSSQPEIDGEKSTHKNSINKTRLSQIKEDINKGGFDSIRPDESPPTKGATLFKNPKKVDKWQKKMNHISTDELNVLKQNAKNGLKQTSQSTTTLPK